MGMAVALTLSLLDGGFGGDRHVAMRQRACNCSGSNGDCLGFKIFRVRKGRSSDDRRALCACWLPYAQVVRKGRSKPASALPAIIACVSET